MCANAAWAAFSASMVSSFPRRRRSNVTGGHLQHLDPGGVQVPHQPGAVGAGAFHPDPGDVTVRAHPPQHRPVPRPGRRERRGGNNFVTGIDDCGYVEILVGVHPTNNHRRRSGVTGRV